MKTKDQILLEEAYKQVSSAKIVRRATEEELNRMEEYCNEQFKPDFLKSYDFSKGWVWDLEDEGDYFVSIKDSDPVKCNATKMKGYATIGLSRIDKEDIYWMGQTDFHPKADPRAIEEYENLLTELPELEGIF